MKLTETKLKQLILETMDDDWDQSMSQEETIAKGMTKDPADIENMLFMADSANVDLSEIGRYLEKDTARYIENLIASRTKPEWAPILITSQDTGILDGLLQSWYKSKDILSDDQLIKLYKSAPNSFKNLMAGYTSLPPAVRKVIDELKGIQRRGKSRLRMSLRKNKK
tara:strand:+ start:176 stop:676 length:501 start_codon:yes stop_codon:yes gene_type:complete